MVGNIPQEPDATGGLSVPWQGKAPALRKCDLLAGACFQPSTVNTGRQFEKNPFLNDRSRNVIENKGPLWKTGRRSRNLYENTGT
jgi:hypothetical protein